MTAEDDNSAFAGFRRLVSAIRSVDPRTAAAIAAEVGLEREIDQVLSSYLKRPSELGDMRLPAKLRVLRALTNDLWSLKVTDATLRFHQYRNELAHGADATAIGKKFEKLCSAVMAFGFERDHDATAEDPGTLAALISAAITLIPEDDS